MVYFRNWKNTQRYHNTLGTYSKKNPKSTWYLLHLKVCPNTKIVCFKATAEALIALYRLQTKQVLVIKYVTCFHLN